MDYLISDMGKLVNYMEKNTIRIHISHCHQDIIQMDKKLKYKTIKFQTRLFEFEFVHVSSQSYASSTHPNVRVFLLIRWKPKDTQETPCKKYFQNMIFPIFYKCLFHIFQHLTFVSKRILIFITKNIFQHLNCFVRIE